MFQPSIQHSSTIMSMQLPSARPNRRFSKSSRVIGFCLSLGLLLNATWAGAQWSAAGNLANIRANATATTLPNGQVLVAGGDDGNNVITATAELYDPATNLWTAANSFVGPRYGHTATLTQNGKVLVAGGIDSNGVVSVAQIYNPATGFWNAAGMLNTGRGFAAATLLNNGKVLITGGTTFGVYFSSTELYDPVTNIWSPAASMSVSRSNHTATLLSNGKVLVTGGYGGGGVGTINSAELYDPATNTWSSAGSMTSIRNSHTATRLSNNKVLIAGGYNGSNAINAAELYDPITNTWSVAGSMSTVRFVHTAVLLANNQVLAIGGSIGTGSLSSAELYDPATNSWSNTSALTAGRQSPATALLANGSVLVAGGYGSTIPLASAELYTYTALTPQVITGFASTQKPANSAFQFVANTSLTLIATGGASGNPIVYASSSPAVCTVAANIVTLLTPGSCNLTADQAGNATFAPAPQALVSFFGLLSQVITGFNPATPIAFVANGTFTLSATGGASGNPVVFASLSPAICTVTPGTATVTMVAAGTCALTADQAYSASYFMANQVPASVVLSPTLTPQSISGFTSTTIPAGSTIGFVANTSLTLIATGGASGNPVVFASNSPAVCTVAANIVTFLAPGTCNLTANQAGNATFAAAAQAIAMFNTGIVQTITNFNPATPIMFVANSTFTLSATGGASGSTVIFGSLSPNYCTVTPGTATVTMVAAGTCTLTANQAAGNGYFSANQVPAIVVLSASLTPQTIIGFTPATPLAFVTNSTFTLSATGGASGNALAFASTTPAVCTVSNATVTMLTAGTCNLTANQAGNAAFAAAPQVPASVVFTGSALTPQTLTLGLLPNHRASDVPFSIATNGSSGIAATFVSTTQTVCRISSTGLVTLTGLLGTCSVNADVVGNAQFSSATAIGSFQVIAGVPGIPQAFACTAGLAQVSCSFTAPAAPAGGPTAVPVITGYTLICQPILLNNTFSNAVTVSGSGSPLVLNGLPTGILMSCIVTANNSIGIGAPTAPAYVQPYSLLSRHGQIDIDGDGRAEVLVRGNTAATIGTSYVGLYDTVSQQIMFRPTADGGVANRILGIGDFGARGKSDLALQDIKTGDVQLWINFDGFADSRPFVRNVKPGWMVEAIADLDGDGRTDIVWRFNSTPANPSPNPDDNGVVFVWFMKDGVIDEVKQRGGAPVSWNLVGASDLHGNGMADLIYVSPTNQIRSLTALPERKFVNELIGTVPTGFTLVRLGDFSGDGKSDLLFRNAQGKLKLWVMDGIRIVSQIDLPDSDATWELMAIADLNGDGNIDIVFKKPDSTLVVWLMNTGTLARPTVINNAGTVPAGTVAIDP